MSWVAVAIGVGSAVAGGVEANANRQRSKGIIGSAYSIASQRMNLSQLDTRQQVAEASGARGLDNGGGVMPGAAVGPGATLGVGGAHTLGAQQTADLAREQTIEQTGLKNETNADLSNVNAQANESIINGVAGGISTAFGAKGSLNALKSLNTGTGTPATPGGTNTPNQDLASSSFGGIDPVNPLGRGAWASPAAGSTEGNGATGNFNVNG